MRWCIWFLFTKSRKSVLVNCGPLSITMFLGRPNVAKMTRRASSVVSDVAVFIGSASIHLVAASTTTNVLSPSSGLAKSRGRQLHVSFVTGHCTAVCRGGIDAASIQTKHAHTMCSIPASTFGNRTVIRLSFSHFNHPRVILGLYI